MNQIKIIEKSWKAGLAILAALGLSLGGLFLNLAVASATATPNITAKLRVNDYSDSPDAGWVTSLNSQAGHRVQFDIEIHNTVVGTSAHDVTAKVNLPSSASTSLSIPLTVTTTNANSASSSVAINIPAPGASIHYVPGSTKLFWDRDGDGVKEFNNAQLIDGIVGSGIRIGNQSGCNAFIIKIEFLADLKGAPSQPSPTPKPSPTPTPKPSPTPTPKPSPTPTPSPTPPASPTPTPPSGGDITITNTNTNTNTQNQTVNVGSVQGAVTKSPETGVGVLGMMTMFGAGPVGLALARFGRGRTVVGKKEENLAELAKNLVDHRFGNSQDA